LFTKRNKISGYTVTGSVWRVDSFKPIEKREVKKYF
jgi:hypothetical protein